MRCIIVSLILIHTTYHSKRSENLRKHKVNGFIRFFTAFSITGANIM